MNTDDLEDALFVAERRVLEIQTKLHRWARDDPHRRFDDLFNLVADPAFLLVAWDRVRGNKGAKHCRGGRPYRGIRRGWAGCRGVPRRAAVGIEGPQLPPAAGAGADDPQDGRQAAPTGDRDDHRPGGPGVPEAGAGADLRGGLPTRAPTGSARTAGLTTRWPRCATSRPARTSGSWKATSRPASTRSRTRP